MINNKASVGKRIAGGVLDCFVCLAVFIVLGIILGDAYASTSSHGSVSVGVSGPSIWIGSILIIAVFSFLEFKFGKTPGKFICKTKVVTETGAAITLGQSVIRNLLRLIDGIFFYLVGLIIISIDKNNQRLGDLVAKTIVTDEEKSS